VGTHRPGRRDSGYGASSRLREELQFFESWPNPQGPDRAKIGVKRSLSNVSSWIFVAVSVSAAGLVPEARAAALEDAPSGSPLRAPELNAAKESRWQVEAVTLKNGLRVRMEATPGGAEVAVCTAVGLPLSNPFASEPDYGRILAKVLEVGGARGKTPLSQLLAERAGRASVRVEPGAVSYCTTVPARELPFALWLAESRFLPLARGADDLSGAAPGTSDGSDSEQAPAVLLEAKLRKLAFLGRFRSSEGNDSEPPSSQELEDYHREHFVAENVTLALSGGFDPEKAKTLIESYLGHIARGNPTPRQGDEVRAQTTERFSVAFDSASKTPAAAYGWALPQGELGDQARIALMVLASSTRLGGKFRAQGGPASEVQAHFDLAGPYGLGFLYVVGRYAAAPELIEREVERAIADLAARGPTLDELHAAEAELRARRQDLVRTPAERAELLGLGQLVGDELMNLSSFEAQGPEPLERQFRSEQVRMAASHVLSQELRSTVEYYPRGWKDPWETPMPVYHIVSAGQSLSSIAKAHGTTVSVIAGMNKLNARTPIYPGDKLRVPRGKPKPQLKTHTLKKGETLSHLAVFYGVSVKALAEQNGLSEKQRLRSGQTLEIPAGASKSKDANEAHTPPVESRSHTVRSGETLSGIAHRYGLSTDELARENGLGPKALVRVGQKLRVPAAKGPAPGEPSSAPHALKGPAPAASTEKANPEKPSAEKANPEKLRSHTVKKGDTLIGIAHKYGVRVDDLVRLNSLSQKKPLQLGQKLVIPGAGARASETR
jgi:LysM repeat protein